jgi:F0F1-type ATP synthase assembly protein I
MNNKEYNKEHQEQATEEDAPRLADTTSEEDRHSLSQRQVNMVWERTQSSIALAVVVTTCVGIFIGRIWLVSSMPLPAEWWTIVGLVIGFYFGRTNHAKVGGVQLGR